MFVEIEMPKQTYSEDRRVAFQSLATSLRILPIGLRSVLSNVFVSMARQGRRRA